MAGAISPGEVERILSDVGFKEIAITRKEQGEEIIRQWNVGEDAEKVVFSAYIKALKPSITEKGGGKNDRPTSFG